MTRYLVSEENPKGLKLEEILRAIRDDIFKRCTKISPDHRAEAQQVLANNVKILNLLTEAIERADESTLILNKAFGPSHAPEGGPPRIGEP